MNAYSSDLRKKIVQALARGATKTEAARSFGVSRSSVKRYAKLAEQGRPLAPKRRPGSKPRMDERARRRLLEADLRERPAATLSERSEFLGRVAGVRVSESTVSRMVKRLGWSRKKIAGSGGARRAPEGRLAGARGRGMDAGRLVFVDEMGSNVSLSPLYGWSRRGERAFGSAPRNWGKNVTLLASMTCRGVGPCLAVEGATTREVFEAYLERVLAPTLVPGQVVVMEDLSAHKGGRVEVILGEAGCGPLYLPRPTLRSSTPSSRPWPRSRA
jgi:transposase